LSGVFIKEFVEVQILLHQPRLSVSILDQVSSWIDSMRCSHIAFTIPLSVWSEDCLTGVNIFYFLNLSFDIVDSSSSTIESDPDVSFRSDCLTKLVFVKRLLLNMPIQV